MEVKGSPRMFSKAGSMPFPIYVVFPPCIDLSTGEKPEAFQHGLVEHK